MEQSYKNINLKTRINLSRITPLALVVGAAGFLGSNLVDSLLEKRIQVIGVDDFSKGKRSNLESAVRSKNFHLLEANASYLNLDVERLDYIFIIADHFGLDSLLKLFSKHKAKCLLVSWVDLYGHKSDNLIWFKEAEGRIAKFANENSLNARVLRLGPVFGPRMHFNTNDPIIGLIHASLTGNIQKEIAMDFSSRALFIDDSVNLIIKSELAGATAQKIFDGVLPTPIKVTEIKQVLLDPVWYEEKGFIPSELPPWHTPNLERTMSFLNWKPKTDLVEALRRTLIFFKDNEIEVPRERKALELGEPEKNIWEEEKRKQLEAFREIPKKDEVKKGSGLPVGRQGFRMPGFGSLASGFYMLLATVIIVAGLIYPIFAFGFGVVTFRIQLQNASDALSKGDFNTSSASLDRAKVGIDEAQEISDSLEVIRKTNIFKNQFDLTDQLLSIASQSLISMRSATLGIEALYIGLKATTGEITDPPFEYFTKAEVDLEFANSLLSSAQAILKDEILSKNKLPEEVLRLSENLENFNKAVKKAHTASILLPKIISSNKSFLVLLQNNTELRPVGGVIEAYGVISFEAGKLKKFEFFDISSSDEKLKIHVEPPKEIKEDLGKKDWSLRDSFFEPDFPTSAKQAEWFFNQENGVALAGILALDLTALENLLSALGPVNLPDLKEKVTEQNISEKVLVHAKPTDSTKISFLTNLTNQLFNKVFFLPNQNWPAVALALGESLEGKHMSVFLDDPKLFSYLLSQNWSGVLPRVQDLKQGLYMDFLAPNEANLGANYSNFYLQRAYEMETAIGKEGEIKHRLKINYTNSSPNNVYPAGKYKNRFKLYLPFGAKLTRVLWGETNITKEIAAFVDYGRSAFSMLLELASKEQKALIVDYEMPTKLEFIEGKSIYRLDIIKQAGTLKDPFIWKITYPISYKVLSSDVTNNSLNIGPQEQKIVTDLNKDRSFEVIFTK